MMVSAKDDPRRAGTIWAFDPGGSTPDISLPASTTFFRVEIPDADELAGALGNDALSEILTRFETGRRCYAARVDGKLAAYGWVSFGDEFVGELDLRIRLLPGEAYIWDCATLPAFRRNHLYSALLVYVAGELVTESIFRAWIGADLDNIPSQRGIARAGFTYVADLFIARVVTLRQVWLQGRPDVPDSLVAEARRVFLNNRDGSWLKFLPSAPDGQADRQ